MKRLPLSFFSCSLFSALCAFTPVVVSAQTASPPVAQPTQKTEEPKKEEEFKPKVLKPGTLASTGSYAAQPVTIDQVTDGSVAGDETMAIGASVSRVGTNKCRITVKNSDDKLDYSVRVEAVSDSRGNGFPKKKSFSGVVKAKGEMTRDFSCEPLDNFSVNLKSGKSLKPKQ